MAIAKAAAPGVTSGIASEMQGGKFSTGFASSFAAALFTPEATGNVSQDYSRAVLAAIVGGKFANSAMTAALQFLYNSGAHPTKNEQKYNPPEGTRSLTSDEKTKVQLTIDETRNRGYDVVANRLQSALDSGRIVADPSLSEEAMVSFWSPAYIRFNPDYIHPTYFTSQDIADFGLTLVEEYVDTYQHKTGFSRGFWSLSREASFLFVGLPTATLRVVSGNSNWLDDFYEYDSMDPDSAVKCDRRMTEAG